MEFFTKEDGYPMSISIETMSVDKIDDDTCLYESIVIDTETNKIIAEFCHNSLLGRRKWAEGFFKGMDVEKLKPESRTRPILSALLMISVAVSFILISIIFDINGSWFGWIGGGVSTITFYAAFEYFKEK
jgi:hypothetical protein